MGESLPYVHDVLFDSSTSSVESPFTTPLPLDKQVRSMVRIARYHHRLLPPLVSEDDSSPDVVDSTPIGYGKIAAHALATMYGSQMKLVEVAPSLRRSIQYELRSPHVAFSMARVSPMDRMFGEDLQSDHGIAVVKYLGSNEWMYVTLNSAFIPVKWGIMQQRTVASTRSVQPSYLRAANKENNNYAPGLADGAEERLRLITLIGRTLDGHAHEWALPNRTLKVLVDIYALPWHQRYCMVNGLKEYLKTGIDAFVTYERSIAKEGRDALRRGKLEQAAVLPSVESEVLRLVKQLLKTPETEQSRYGSFSSPLSPLKKRLQGSADMEACVALFREISQEDGLFVSAVDISGIEKEAQRYVGFGEQLFERLNGLHDGDIPVFPIKSDAEQTILRRVPVPVVGVVRGNVNGFDEFHGDLAGTEPKNLLVAELFGQRELIVGPEDAPGNWLYRLHLTGRAKSTLEPAELYLGNGESIMWNGQGDRPVAWTALLRDAMLDALNEVGEEAKLPPDTLKYVLHIIPIPVWDEATETRLSFSGTRLESFVTFSPPKVLFQSQRQLERASVVEDFIARLEPIAEKQMQKFVRRIDQYSMPHVDEG